MEKLFPIRAAQKTSAWAAVLLAALIMDATSSFAQQGQNVSLLKQALSEAAGGNCSSKLMSPLLLATCRQQMPVMGQRLAQLGSIQDAEYLGIEQTPSGPAEVYQVSFEQGGMTWMISTGPNGKIVILWSPG